MKCAEICPGKPYSIAIFLNGESVAAPTICLPLEILNSEGVTAGAVLGMPMAPFHGSDL